MDLRQQALLFAELQEADVATTQKKLQLFIKYTGSTQETYFGWLKKWRELDAISDHDEKVKRMLVWAAMWAH